MFAYQEDGRYFAQAARGLEELARDELQELGAGEQKLTALSGKFLAFVKIDLFLWEHRWDWEIFNWKEGFTYDGPLFEPFYEEINLATGAVTQTYQKDLKVRINRLKVNRDAVALGKTSRQIQDEIKNLGYYVVVGYSGKDFMVRDTSKYYKDGTIPDHGVHTISPYWELKKKIPPNQQSKTFVDIWPCYPQKASRNSHTPKNSPDGKYPCGCLRLDPVGSCYIKNLTYDWVAKTYRMHYHGSGGDRVVPAGQYTTLTGPDGEIDFTVCAVGDCQEPEVRPYVINTTIR